MSADRCESIALEETTAANNTQAVKKNENIILKITLTTAISFSWVGSSQFAKSSFDQEFKAPLLLLYASTVVNLLNFPILAIIALFYHPKRKQENTKSDSTYISRLYSIFKESHQVFGQSAGIVKVVLLAAVFTALYLLPNYAYMAALEYVNVGDVIAIFSTNIAFTYILSLVFLHQSFIILPIFAVIFSITGILMIANNNESNKNGLFGVTLVVSSSILAAIYKVAFCKVVGNKTNFTHVLYFLACIGVTCLISVWPLIIILKLNEIEAWQFTTIPYFSITCMSLLAFVFNCLLNIAIVVTEPVTVSIGIAFGIPLSYCMDIIFRGQPFSVIKVIGSGMLLVAFIIMILPDKIQTKTTKMFCKCFHKESSSSV